MQLSGRAIIDIELNQFAAELINNAWTSEVDDSFIVVSDGDACRFILPRTTSTLCLVIGRSREGSAIGKRMRAGAKRFSAMLTRLGVRHIFEIHDNRGKLVDCAEYDWHPDND